MSTDATHLLFTHVETHKGSETILSASPHDLGTPGAMVLVSVAYKRPGRAAKRITTAIHDAEEARRLAYRLMSWAAAMDGWPIPASAD